MMLRVDVYQKMHEMLLPDKCNTCTDATDSTDADEPLVVAVDVATLRGTVSVGQFALNGTSKCDNCEEAQQVTQLCIATPATDVAEHVH
jgi:hypothetical protein